MISGARLINELKQKPI